jgi:hypothetical protein
MTPYRCFGLSFLGLAVLIGCTKSSTAPQPDTQNTNAVRAKGTDLAPSEAKIQAALAKLADADRPLAQAQKFCPIQKTRLGSMGKPARIEIEGQPVFLCCSGCADEARKDPKATLDQVARFKREN